MTQEVRILVVDDETSVLESFKMILKIKDYEVDTYVTGNDALANFGKGKYDIAFVDMILPMVAEDNKRVEKGGLEVLKRIKLIDPDIEVNIVTAYATDATHANAISLGAMEYLRKPFLMEEIYELVDRGLKRRRAKGIKKSPSAPPPTEIH